MNKCVVIPGHVQLKIQQLTNTPESETLDFIHFFNIVIWFVILII